MKVELNRRELKMLTKCLEQVYDEYVLKCYPVYSSLYFKLLHAKTEIDEE